MNAISIANFAAPAANGTRLPTGRALALPGGVLGICDNGRVFVHDRWIVAVGISPELFIVLTCVSERQVPAALREQLVGYLTACGAEVVCLQIRFPWSWHAKGSLLRTIIFWIFRLVETLSISLEPNLGQDRPRLALPIGAMAQQTQAEWLWIGQIWRMIEDEFPSALPQLDWLLWELSHRWELRWALILRDGEDFGLVSPEDRTYVELCDRAWVALIRRQLVPHGYEMLPATMARLL
ncbi:MAG: hypothetical protein ACLQVY_10740 [Limisphaerales bacterium]